MMFLFSYFFFSMTLGSSLGYILRNKTMFLYNLVLDIERSPGCWIRNCLHILFLTVFGYCPNSSSSSLTKLSSRELKQFSLTLRRFVDWMSFRMFSNNGKFWIKTSRSSSSLGSLISFCVEDSFIIWKVKQIGKGKTITVKKLRWRRFKKIDWGKTITVKKLRWE